MNIDERIAEVQAELDKPASIKGPSLDTLVEDDLTPKVEADVTTSEETEEETPTGGKKMRIPASRWKTVQAKAEAAEAEAAQLRDRLASLETEVRSRPQTDNLPDWWKKDYGEDENSKKAYSTFKQGLKEELRQERQYEQEQERIARQQADARVVEIAEGFDNQMEDLEEELGKNLSDREKTELLEIVEQYSPQDEQGNYPAFISVQKAYELSQKLAVKNPAKERMAEIAAASSEGSSAPTQNSGPLSWDGWRSKYGM